MLGPILFLIYFNEFCKLHLDCTLISFADDTVLYWEGDTWDEIYTRANETLKTIKLWLDNNKLSLNTQKTIYIPFSIYATGQPNSIHTITIHKTECHHMQCNCELIQRVDSTKYLGVIIDKHLRWDEHGIITAKRIRKTAYKFKELRSVLNPDILRTVYFSLVHSIVQYGILAWGGTHEGHIDCIAKAQKLILKIAFKKPWRYPSDQLFADANVPTLHSIYLLNLFKYAHKNRFSFHTINHEHNTRHRELSTIYPDRVHKSIYKHSPTYQSIKIFNKLPIHIQHINNIATFKTAVTRWLQEQTNEIINGLLT